MLLNKREVRLAVGVLNLFCVAFSLFLCIRSFFTTQPEPVHLVMATLLIFALVMAAVYALKGGKKAAAEFYQGFCWSYLSALLVCTVNSVQLYLHSGATPVMMIATAIGFVAVLIVTVGKDLGRALSCCLCGVNFAAAPVIAVFTLLETAKGTMDANVIPWDMLMSILTLAALLGLAVYYKYEDKIARGRKV